MIKIIRREWLINKVAIALSLVGAFVAGWKIEWIGLSLAISIFVAGMVQRTSMSKYEKNKWQRFLSSLGISRKETVNNHFILNATFLFLLVVLVFIGYITSAWVFNSPILPSLITINGIETEMSNFMSLQISMFLSLGLILGGLRSFAFFLLNRRAVTYLAIITLPTMVYFIVKVCRAAAFHKWLENSWNPSLLVNVQWQHSLAILILALSILFYSICWFLSLTVYKKKDL